MNTFFLVCLQMQKSFLNQKKEVVLMVSIEWLISFICMTLQNAIPLTTNWMGKLMSSNIVSNIHQKCDPHHQRKDMDLFTRYMKSCFYEWGKQAWQYTYGWMHGRMNQFGNNIVHFFAT
jgi:hypothetical protein